MSLSSKLRLNAVGNWATGLSRCALIISIAGACLVSVALLWGLMRLSQKPQSPILLREPGLDTNGIVGAAEQAAPFLRGKLITGTGTPSTVNDAWPQFRGAQGTGIAPDQPAIARQWESGGPPKLWEIQLGKGYASAAVRQGRVYIFDYDQTNRADVMRCLSLDDGKEIWQFSYPLKVKSNHGMSRTIPTVTDKYVVGLGPKCHVICLDSITGAFQWGIDLVKEYNVEVPQWYAGECPVVDGDRVILGVGGDSLMIAVDIATGKVIWKTPNPHDWKMTHVTIATMEFAGQRQYVYCGSGGVVGVAADDGRLLWETDAWAIPIATCPTPVPIGDGRIFFSGGYDAGAMMLKLNNNDGKIVPEVLFRLTGAVYGVIQQTPILYQGYIYAVRQDGKLACLDLSGKVVWTSDPQLKFGLGPLLLSNGLIFLLSDEGWLGLVEASPKKYQLLAKARILNEVGHDACGPLALAGGRLFARDFTRMVCLNITGGKL